MRVAVLSTHDPGVPPFFLRYTTQVLRRIGYDATQKFQPNGLSGYFATISNRSANVQVGGYGWRLDFPVPANLLQTVFHCGNHIDPSWFCSRAFDRLMNHAINLEQRDQARAGIAWTNADHLLTDLVPWVPLVDHQGVDFIADRVRNYERNPQVGVLLDQLWVR
jgi:ABC-type transport system substrate-binding protein